MKSIVGKILYDRYRVVRQLSKNNWSTLYLAEDLAGESRVQCCIEQLQPSYDGEILGQQSWQKVRQAFLVRGNLQQKVSQHPQVIQLLAFFECDREFYLVREFIEAATLEQRLKNSSIDESEAIAWLQEILRILEFAHKSGVAHLNIQPTSLVQLQNGTKCLTNFAAIKNTIIPKGNLGNALNGDFAPDSDRFQSDFNADIYALGKTIIYALTGRLAGSIQNKSFDKVESGQLTNLNNSPVADIRPELARILNKMVTSPAKRSYQSVAEVLEELDFQQNVVTFPSPFAASPRAPRQNNFRAEGNTKPQKSANSSKPISTIIWFLLSLPFIVASAIFFVGLNKNFSRSFVEYINDDYQFSLTYPQNWSQQQLDDPITGEIVVFNSPPETDSDLFLERVHVAVEYLSSPTSLEKYSQTVLKRIKETEGSNTESYRDFPSTIDNAPARTVIYARQQGSLQLRQMESFTIKNNRVYIAIYTAERAKFSKFYPTVEKMLASWEIQ